MKSSTFYRTLAVFLLVFLIPLSAGVYAVTLGTYEKGLLLPFFRHDGNSMDTVVGIVCDRDSRVWWTIFNERSMPVMDGFFCCSRNDFYEFSLNNEAHNTPETGYVVFTANGASEGTGVSSWLQNDHRQIYGNAFMVDLNAGVSSFIPAVPLSYYDYNRFYVWGLNLTWMIQNAIIALGHGFEYGQGGTADFRYWIDPEMGASTEIIIWTTECLKEYFNAQNMPSNCFLEGETGNASLYCAVNVYDEDENRISTRIALGCELTRIRVDEILGFPSGYKKGFMRIPLRDLLPHKMSGAFGFSLVTSTLLNSVEAMLAGERYSTLDSFPGFPNWFFGMDAGGD